MKKAAWLFLFLFSWLQIVATVLNGNPEKNSLGIAQKVEGNVFILLKEGIEKKNLKTGDWISSGQTILTGKKSQLLIRFHDGVLKLIPENTKISFIHKEWIELYKKTDSSIEKLSVTLGTKAAENKVWFSDQESQEKDIEKLFLNKKYLEIIALYEKNPLLFRKSQALMEAGISYFKLGIHKKSEVCFQTLQGKFGKQEEESACFALALLALRENKNDEFSQYQDLLKKNFPDSPLLEELKKLTVAKENE